MSNFMFKGIYTALLTPFKKGEIDYSSLENMINWQIDSGVRGLVIAGSTGEGQNLSRDEFLKLVDKSIKFAKGRVPIIANTGSLSTIQSIELSQAVQKLKVDGIMLVTPYYVKPSQEGIFQHFKAVHDCTNLPILIYNNPARCSVDISLDTVIRLAALPRIKAIKDSSGDPLKCAKIMQHVEDSFQVLCGDDILALQYFSQGAKGLISVTSNIVPTLMVKLHHLWNNNRINDAMELQGILLPFIEAIFCESNPIAIKYAASIFGVCLPELRLPLVGPSEKNQELVKIAIEQLKAKLYEHSN